MKCYLSLLEFTFYDHLKTAIIQRQLGRHYVCTHLWQRYTA